MYAPAQGTVLHINEEHESECLRARCLKLSIFMSPLDVHVNRMPISGTLRYFKYHAGAYLYAYLPKASTLNEHTTLLMESKTGTPVLFRQIAGFLARRIKYYVKEGQTYDVGRVFGFIKFGSRVDIFFPLGTKLLVEPRAKVYAGVTPLAKLD